MARTGTYECLCLDGSAKKPGATLRDVCHGTCPPPFFRWLVVLFIAVRLMYVSNPSTYAPDINECDRDNGGCAGDQRCVNWDGGSGCLGNIPVLMFIPPDTPVYVLKT